MCRPKYGPDRDIERQFRTDRQLRKLGIIKEPLHVTVAIYILAGVLWLFTRRLNEVRL